jgi:sugar lactone lactonase YvrE
MSSAIRDGVRAVAILLLLLQAAAAQQYTISTFAGGSTTAIPSAAANTSLYYIKLTFDQSGNLYTIAGNSIYKIDPAGNISLFAGNSRGGYAGDGGLAIDAQLNGPGSMVFDTGGNLLICDTGNFRVRKISPDGIITTFAGNGGTDSTGDGGPATNAQLLPIGIVVDAAGNVIVTDHRRVRKISRDGIITTIAGNGTNGFSGDGGPAVNAQIFFAMPLAIDSAGNICFGDGARIRKISTDGIITTIAGTGVGGYSGDGGPAISAAVEPNDLKTDAAGTLYMVGLNRVRKIDQNGIISTVAGTGAPGFSADGGSALDAKLQTPEGLAFDRSGNLYIADTGNLRIRTVTTAGIIQTIAGSGGTTVTQLINFPPSVALDHQGNVYVPDYLDNFVQRISPDGKITRFAGTGSVLSPRGDGGPAVKAALHGPRSVAVDSQNNVYITDLILVRKVTSDGIISTYAGNGTTTDSGDGGPASQAGLESVWGLAIDLSDNLYVAENYRIRKITKEGTITTVAGNGTKGDSGDGSLATSAQLSRPWGIAADAFGNLFIAESPSCRIRKVTPDGIIRTIAGNGTCGYSGDSGPALSATLGEPFGVAVDAAGNVFIPDISTDRIRMISAASGNITTIAGTGWAGYDGDGGPATQARLYGPEGLALDPAGKIYVADTANNTIRLLQPVKPGTALSISTATLPSAMAGTPYAQNVSASGGTPPYVWSLIGGSLPPGLTIYSSGSLAGTTTSAGVYTFTAQVTDLISETASASFAITVLNSVPVITTATALVPAATGLNYSQTLVAAGGNPPFNWILKSGTLPLGLSLAPSGTLGGVPSTTGTFTFTAQVTDSASLSSSQSFTITVVSGATLMRAGVIAHIAAGGPWTTRIYLSNAGNLPSPVSLVFHADDGTLLVLPLTIGQRANPQSQTASSVSAVLNPQETITVDLEAQLADTITGWIDVLAATPLSGYAVFKTSQAEATSPLQQQVANSLSISYDNTAGMTTGIALANLSTAPATFTVNLFDQSGQPLKSQTLSLPAAGHTSFLLPASFPASAGLQGVVQFQSPAVLAGVGLQISPQGLFTSIPVVTP